MVWECGSGDWILKDSLVASLIFPENAMCIGNDAELVT